MAGSWTLGMRRSASPPSGLAALAFPPLRGGPPPLQARVLTVPKQYRRILAAALTLFMSKVSHWLAVSPTFEADFVGGVPLGGGITDV